MNISRLILQHEDKIPLVKNYEEIIFANVAPCNPHGVASGMF